MRPLASGDGVFCRVLALPCTDATGVAGINARFGADCGKDCDFGFDSNRLSRCTINVLSGTRFLDVLVRFCSPLRESSMRASIGDSTMGCPRTGLDILRDALWAGPGHAIVLKVRRLCAGVETIRSLFCLCALGAADGAPEVSFARASLRDFPRRRQCPATRRARRRHCQNPFPGWSARRQRRSSQQPLVEPGNHGVAVVHPPLVIIRHQL